MLDFRLCRRPVLQKLHDLLLPAFNVCGMLRNSCLNLNQLLSGCPVFPGNPNQFFPQSFLFLFQRSFLLLPRFNFNTHCIHTIIIVFVIHTGRIDLFLQNIDLSFQLLFQKIGLIELISGGFDCKINAVDFFLNGIILRLHLLITSVRLFHFFGSRVIFFLRIPDSFF